MTTEQALYKLLIPDKVDFNSKLSSRGKKVHYILAQRAIPL